VPEQSASVTAKKLTVRQIIVEFLSGWPSGKPRVPIGREPPWAAVARDLPYSTRGAGLVETSFSQNAVSEIAEGRPKSSLIDNRQSSPIGFAQRVHGDFGQGAKHKEV
jgi:hypothetical protein